MVIKKKDDIIHYNRWFTDRIKAYLKNLDTRIKFLFKPYESFRKMSILFSLKESYLEDNRNSKEHGKSIVKKIISESVLNIMGKSLNKHILGWIKDNPRLKDELIKVRSDLIEFINEYKIKFKPKSTPRSQIQEYHQNFNKNYFSTIDTKEKAYWLGFLFADGYITIEHLKSGDYYRFGLGLAIKDKQRVIDFCDAVGLNSEYIKDVIRINPFTNKPNTISLLRFQYGKTDEKQGFSQDLIKLGMEYEYNEEKGHRVKKMQFPDLGSRELIIAFLLGFYDGDGSLHKRDNNRVYPRIVSSQKEIITKIKQYFGIKTKITSYSSKRYILLYDKYVDYTEYGLELGSTLFREMLNNYKNSLERKRVPLEFFNGYDLTPQRNWLLNNLPKQELEQILEILSPSYIAELLGTTREIIVWLAEEKYNIRIISDGSTHYTVIRRNINTYDKSSPYYKEFQYWSNYLGDLKKTRKN